MTHKQLSRQALDKWRHGIPYELAFWNNTYRWPHTFRGMMNWSNYGAVLRLEGFDTNAFFSSLQDTEVPLDGSNPPKVLDVGSGLSYDVGGRYVCRGREKPLEVHYVDPLAPRFNRILYRYKKPLPPVEFGMLETLSTSYPHHDIDLVIVQNALDHSSSPVSGIYECLDTLRPGGVLYLNHHPDEAETEDYKGFHQYNIRLEGTDLVLWNKEERVNVTHLLDGLATVSTRRMNTGHVVAVCRKVGEVPARLLCDKERADELTRQALAKPSLSDRLRYMLYNAIQFFVQALPWSVRMRLKRFIGQTQ